MTIKHRGFEIHDSEKFKGYEEWKLSVDRSKTKYLCIGKDGAEGETIGKKFESRKKRN